VISLVPDDDSQFNKVLLLLFSLKSYGVIFIWSDS
jgi:hypothetical protein